MYLGKKTFATLFSVHTFLDKDINKTATYCA
jgi:hypothetical protein